MQNKMIDAIATGRTELVFDVLEGGLPASYTDESGVSLIQHCAYYGDVSAMRFLLSRIQGWAAPKKNLTADQECCQKGRRRELLLNALLYLTAVENNMLLLSGNIRHMDLLLQIRPSRNVLLYRATE